MRTPSRVALVAILSVFLVIGAYLTMATQPLNSKWDTLFCEKPEVITEHSQNNVIHLTNTEVKHHDLSRSHFINDRFDDVHFDDAIFQYGSLTNVTFSGGTLHDTSFGRSILTDVVFEDMKMEKAIFVGATLIDVTFKNCVIRNSHLHNLKASKVTFENCDMANVEFFDSELDITLINTRIHEMGMFGGLKPGSRVTLKNSYIGPYSDFSSSHLASFTAVGSELERFGITGTAREVTLKSSKLDFTLGSTDIDRLNVTGCQIDRLSHSDGSIKHATITDCKHSTGLSFIQSNIGEATVRQCNLYEFQILESKFGRLTASKSDFFLTDAGGFIAGELIMQDLNLTNEVNLKNALADETLLHNVTVAPGATLELTGSNIPLKR